METSQTMGINQEKRSSFHSRTAQQAVPSIQEMLPAIIGFSVLFLFGFVCIVLASSGNVSSRISFGGFGIGISLCVVFGGLILMNAHKWHLANKLDEKGLIARGTIIDLWEGDGSGHYHVAYRFELSLPSAESTQQFVIQQSINFSLYRQLQVDSKVRVRFLPGNPNVSRMELRSWKWEY
jgi:hypothetical protein